MEEARLIRDKEVADALDHALYVTKQLEEANTTVKHLLKAKLPTKRTEYVRIGPGHPDWDKAEFDLNPILYSGDWKFDTKL